MKSTLDVHPDTARRPSAGPIVRGMVRRAGLIFQGPSLAKGLPAILDQAIVSGTAFLTTVFVGRMVSQSDLGIYYLALSIVLVVRGIHVELVSSPYTVYCNRRQGLELASYSGSSFVHQCLLTMFSLICVGFGALLLSTGMGPAGLASVIWTLLAVLPLLLMREFIRQFNFAHLRPSVALALDAVTSALQLGGLALLVLFQQLHLRAVFLVMGLSCAAACGIWFWLKPDRFSVRLAQVCGDWNLNWSFGRWALAGYLIGSTTPYILPWMISAAHGDARTGMLAACCTLVGLCNMFVTGLSNLLTPRAARAFTSGGVRQLQAVLLKTGRIYVLALGSACLLFGLFGGQLLVFVYGNQFTGGRWVLTLLAGGIFAQAIGITAGNGLWALDRPGANFAADLVTLLATLTVAVLLIVPFGVLGAAAATLVGMSLGSAVRCLTLLRFMHHSTALCSAAEFQHVPRNNITIDLA